MKFIKTIETLATKADKKGFAQIKAYWGDYTPVKYAVTVNGNVATLEHYGTVTARVNTQTNTIMYLYGQSLSDADSISTFLDYYDANSQAPTFDEELRGIHRTFGRPKVNLGFYPSKDQFHIDIRKKSSFDIEKTILIDYGTSGVELNL